MLSRAFCRASMQKQLSSARQKVRSDRIASSSANLALSTAVAAPRLKDVWLRFVPLKVGGVAVDDFGNTVDDFRNLHKTKVSIDLSHSGLQVVQKLIAEFDELKHFVCAYCRPDSRLDEHVR